VASWEHLAILAAALLADAAVQIAACRLTLRRSRGWVFSLAAGAGAGALLAAGAEALWLVPRSPDRADAAGAAAAVLLAYAGFAFFYANVVNGGRTALRVRLLAELQAAPSGLTAAQIVARYRPEELFEARVARLLAGGEVTLQGGRLRIRAGALLAVRRLVTAAKIIVIGRRSEFD
jgi:hypothetical protein